MTKRLKLKDKLLFMDQKPPAFKRSDTVIKIESIAKDMVENPEKFIEKLENVPDMLKLDPIKKLDKEIGYKR